MDSDTAAVIIYMVGGMGFFSALISLIALLTLVRQVRNLQVYHQTRALAAVYAKPIPIARPQPTLLERHIHEPPRVQLSSSPIPREWQMPVREGTPDQVNFVIEPTTEPTREESSVLRLINYLKKMKTAAS